MPNVVALTDLTVHGAPICTEPTNTKINFNGKFFACIGATGPVHVGITHPIVPLPNIITVPMQTKITFNGIPFAVYGAVCSCGDIVCGSLANPKVIIQNTNSINNY